MAKTKISEFSATPANNTDIDSINIAEGCAPSGINDAIRELMAQLKDFQTGAVGDSFNGPVGTSTAAAGAFTTLSASSTATLSGLTASTALALDASKNVVSVTNTGTGSNVLATSPTLVTPILGTPTSATLTNATGLPIATGVSGLGTGIATALAVNTGSAGAPVLFNGALGTPSSGTVTNLTGTASININGTVGATTASTGAFTTLTTSSTVTLNGGTANGVLYLNGSKVATSGSALTFDGTNLAVGGSAVYKFTTVATGSSATALFSTDQSTADVYLKSTGTTYNYSVGLGAAGDSLRFLASAAEGMRLTSTGLGIGTSSPARKLNVAVAYSSGTIVPSIKISTVGGYDSGAGTAIDFGQDQGTYSAWVTGRIASPRTANNWGGSLTFSTNDNSADSALVERMRLDSAGNLGLGVTPSAWNSGYKALQVSSSACFWGGSALASVSLNTFYDATGYKYVANGFASDYYQFGGSHVWQTAPSGTAGNAISFTQAMTLTAAGDLLVGTTASGYGKLTVVNPTGVSAFFSNSTYLDQYLKFTEGTGYTIEANYGLNFNVNTLNAAYPMKFSMGGTERARIDSSGNLLVGTTTRSQQLGTLEVFSSAGSTTAMFKTTAGAANSWTADFWNNDTAGNNLFVEFATETSYTARGSISYNRTGNLTVYNTTSDARLKQNIVDAPSALSKIASIQIRSFDWKETGNHVDFGVIAQELNQVAPEAVTEGEDNENSTIKRHWGVDTSVLVPALVKAIQEQQAIIESLKARLDAANL
jgi:hypothetical protein